MKKNVASQTVCFEMLSTTDGSAVTSGTPTVYVTGDGGTQGTGTGTSTHEGNGCWSYVPTQSETNYDHIAFTMVLTGAFNQTVNVYTTYPQTVDNNTILANGTYGLSALKTLIDTIAGIVDNILVDTGTTLDGKINTIDTVVDAIKAVTDLLPDSGALTTLISHLTDIKGATFSGTTDSLEAIRDRGDAAWLTGAGGSAPTVTEIRTEMDTNSTQLAAILEDTGTTIPGTLSTIAGYVDTEVAAIKAKTDNLPIDPADQSAVEAAITAAHSTTDGLVSTVDTVVDGIQTDLSNGTDGLGALKTLIDTIDTVVDAIKSVTDNLPDSGALSSLATAASLATVDGNVDSILEDTGTTLPAAISALNDITVADIIAGISDGTYDLQEMARIGFAILAGKSTGGGTSTVNFRDTADSKNRMVATVDSNGNRTAVTLTGS